MNGRNIRGRHSSSPAAGRPARFAGLPAAAGFAWCGGACLALWGPWSPGVGALLPAAVLGLLCAVTSRVALACLLGGFVASGAVAHRQVLERWPAALEGQRVLVEGRVDGLPEGGAARWQFDLEGEIVAPASLARPVRLRVTSRDAGTAPRAGERWRLLVRLEPPRAALNPGGFDAERLLFHQRIDALATVVRSRLAVRLAGAGPGLDALRAAIGARIREQVVDRDAAALVAGLAIGATADISPEQWRVFGATGTVHLVAISGLHVTLFAWLATLGARVAWRTLRLGGRVDREPFAASFGILAATAYALLAGFGIPAQRTLVMLLAWWLARLAGRRAGGIDVIGLALLAVLALDPLAPLAAGFWLSFAAIAVLIAADSAAPAPAPSRVGGLPPDAAGVAPAGPDGRAWRRCGAVLVGGLARAMHAAGRLLRTQWQVTVALAPATLLLFGTVPLAGLLANLLAIPLFSAVLVPLILASLAALPFAETVAGAGWQVAQWLYLATWPWFEAMAALPGSTWLHLPPRGWLPVALLALSLGALPGPVPLRATALVALLPLLAPAIPPPERGAFRGWLLEAGDGTALVVQTHAHTLVYDTGDVHGSDGTRAARVVLPALRALGRDELDLLVQSRATGFRVAGVASLLDAVPVRELRSGGRWSGGPRPRLACDAATGWIWDDVEIRVFPAVPVTGAADDGPSCVLRVAAARGAGAALLVPGQLDAGEALQLPVGGGVPGWRAQVVLAPRRGSTSTPTAGLAAAIGARHVLVASRELSPRRRAALARAWGLDPGAVRGTAREGALVIDAPAGAAGVAVSRWLDGQPRRPWRVPRD